MEVINGSIDKALVSGGIACALGFFDGVHIGHQNLFTKLKEFSEQYKLKSMVFTFEKHPLTLINNKNAPLLIMDNDTKTREFNRFGFDIVNYNPIDISFLNMEPEDFLNEILIKKFNVKAIVTGFNFTFGFRGRGDARLITDFSRNLGLHVSIVPPVCIDGIVVSSSIIRNFISSGNIIMANKFLGRTYSLTGTVVHGKGRGHTMGFPTANVLFDKDLVIPKNGVYITKTVVGQECNVSITNIGHNPTFGDNPISVETHIFGYDQDIYGQNIRVEFYDRLRDERVFSDKEDLSRQIDSDMAEALRYFK